MINFIKATFLKAHNCIFTSLIIVHTFNFRNKHIFFASLLSVPRKKRLRARWKKRGKCKTVRPFCADAGRLRVLCSEPAGIKKPLIFKGFFWSFALEQIWLFCLCLLPGDAVFLHEIGQHRFQRKICRIIVVRIDLLIDLAVRARIILVIIV